ncbi:tail tubular protein A [Pseudomonas phage phikF77]|uniref:Putative tail tubular protein A n=1 Tax=Pseudomonas phage phikF77 TaxID=627480 RepID=C0MQG0_9CAUD|nr:tail tubular protein A [Pseudomonas phage phikF77]CAX63154.1 putative tail tubular protein A [Pseudomonas phage phikF77]
MLLLDAVNVILGKIGELPIPSMDETYPTMAIALPELEDQRIQLLTQGWWFNTWWKHKLTPDPQGRINLPKDTLAFYPDSPDLQWDGLGVRDANTGDDRIGKVVEGRLVLSREWDRIPEIAQRVIAHQAALAVYTHEIGPDETAQVIAQELQAYQNELSRMHTRSRPLNTQAKRSFSRWRRSLRT